MQWTCIVPDTQSSTCLQGFGNFMAIIDIVRYTKYSLVQWNWFSGVTGCMQQPQLQWRVREPISLHQAVYEIKLLTNILWKLENGYFQRCRSLCGPWLLIDIMSRSRMLWNVWLPLNIIHCFFSNYWDQYHILDTIVWCITCRETNPNCFKKTLTLVGVIPLESLAWCVQYWCQWLKCCEGTSS